jgi:glycosyltransferase involved in cell wall biosynthesis
MRVSIIAYNEARMLPMCLGHIPHGSDVVVIDGAYRDYPHTEPYSTDGTLDIARRWGADVVEVTKAWPDQIAKRTSQLTPGEVFILDADELLHTDLPELPEDADVGWVTIASPVYERPFLSPRVLRVRDGWHYAGRHHWIYDAEGDLVVSHTYAGSKYRHAILPVTVSNERDTREAGRNGEKAEYLAARNRAECCFENEASVYGGRTAG